RDRDRAPRRPPRRRPRRHLLRRRTRGRAADRGPRRGRGRADRRRAARLGRAVRLDAVLRARGRGRDVTAAAAPSGRYFSRFLIQRSRSAVGALTPPPWLTPGYVLYVTSTLLVLYSSTSCVVNVSNTVESAVPCSTRIGVVGRRCSGSFSPIALSSGLRSLLLS